MKKSSIHRSLIGVILGILVPSWPALAQCQNSNLEDISFLLGNWESVSSSRNIQLQTTKIAQGCAIARKQHTGSIAESFDSLIYVEESGQLQELKIGHNGTVERYRWWQNEEEWVAELIGKAGPQKQRLIIVSLPNNQLSSSLELSTNWGETWLKTEDTTTFSQTAEMQASEALE